MYVNGEVVNTVAGTNELFDFNSLPMAANGAYTTGRFHLCDIGAINCSYNDVRIYDHELSLAEIKELCKALVIHYTFDDILAEPTTNIISGIKSAHGKASLESGRVKINWSPSFDDSYFMFNYIQDIKANGVYTLSFDCEGLKPGEVATFAVSNLIDTSYHIALKNGRNSLTFTAGADLMHDINTYNRLFFDDKSPQTAGAVFYLSNFQLEERDHATPYTPTNRAGILYNETGIIQPSINNNIEFSANTAIGKYSLKCNGNTMIKFMPAGNGENATASFWLKDYNLWGQMVVFADANSGLAFGSYNTYNCISREYGVTS